MKRLFFFVFLFSFNSWGSDYKFHCEVHTIVSVFYDGIISLEDGNFKPERMVTIIDHPIWVKKEDIKMKITKTSMGIDVEIEHIHPAKDGRFIQISATKNNSIRNW